MGEGFLISQYVLLVWFSRALYTWGPIGGGPSALGMHIILNRFYWFGVVRPCTLGLD